MEIKIDKTYYDVVSCCCSGPHHVPGLPVIHFWQRVGKSYQLTIAWQIGRHIYSSMPHERGVNDVRTKIFQH